MSKQIGYFDGCCWYKLILLVVMIKLSKLPISCEAAADLPGRGGFGSPPSFYSGLSSDSTDGIDSKYEPSTEDLFPDYDSSSLLDDDFYKDLKSNLDEFHRQDDEDFDWKDSISGSGYGTTFDSASNSLDGDFDSASSSDTSPLRKEDLYAAYNELHNLAQDYNKGFDAPAVVVVGHQSSGKSALIEALMGFQFNQVGGGTKTRRPIALRMQYNPKYSTPRCYLVGEDNVEREMSLPEIQEFIERENRRLERDPIRSFESREINIRMEYRHCPNLILIDTPGLILAPKVPKGRPGSAAVSQQRALQASAKEAERLVIEKLSCPDYIILCVEDTADWKHGSTREVVQHADPDLSRTVIVNTKFDTKLPQFGTPSDLEDFLSAGILDRLSPTKLGGPYFTSVPSGRVSRSQSYNPESMYDSDLDFVNACAETEATDRAVVHQKIRRMGKQGEIAFMSLSKRIGLSNLRGFLEKKVDECYRRNVAKIIPMLHTEYANCERRLHQCERELADLSIERLKAGADRFCDEFCVALRKVIQGSVIAPASLFGETLSQESQAGGSFHSVQNSPMSVSDRTWERLIREEVGHQDHRLYGGAQYHRTLREFNLATKCLRLPTITEDEIANAAGMGTTHDGVNFLHAACVIALEKARVSFEPLLEALRFRVMHVMGRLCPVTEYMLRETKEQYKISAHKFFDEQAGKETPQGPPDTVNRATDIAQNPQFRQLVRQIFLNFVQKCSDNALSKCRDDLAAITRYVTWNLDDRSSGALQRSLPDKTDLISIYQVAVKASSNSRGDDNDGRDDELIPSEKALKPIADDQRDYFNLLQLLEEATCARDANRTNVVVGSLVQYIVSQWRESFGRQVTMKFNCYFMLPLLEDFHKFMRRELQNIYDGQDDNICEVFDLAAARRALQVHRQELVNECVANKRLQEKFNSLANMMRNQPQ
jgi:GTPase SAR1 family protein